MITEEELTRLREAQEEFMPDRGTLKRREFDGDNESQYDAYATDVHARLTPGFGIWRIVADRYQGVTAFNLSLPWDQDVRAGDVWVASDNRVYEIRDVQAPASYLTARRCLCDLVTD